MTKGVIIFTVIAIVFYLIVTIAEKIYCKKHNITVKEFKKQNEFQKKEFRNRQISRRMDTHGIIVVERFATFHYY